MSSARLLLVDDERNVLDGLRRVLRPLRTDWEVRTATSGAEALSMLEEQPADVVVTDMRMPVMDGSALLAIVKERIPSAVRIVLSGQTDHSAALRVVSHAHQFLSKPCEPSELIDTLVRVKKSILALDDAGVGATLVGGITALPSCPQVWSQVVAAVATDTITVESLGRTIETDPAFACKLLQLTSSPFFGLRRTIASVADAVSYLGLALTRSLVGALAETNEAPPRALRFDAHAFWQRSVRTAYVARFLAARSEAADDWFAAGLLHDLGKLVLASAMPDRYDAIAGATATSGRTFEEEESAATGCAPHVRLNAHLLNLWGLPASVVDAVAEQGRAPQLQPCQLGGAGAVYLGRQLVAEATGDATAVDSAFAERMGLGERLKHCREYTAHLVTQ